ncbi:MAG: DUF1566 domain-containing protein [Gammaproteobacteria bacterium]|nr:DUF1566 domain-containing protein [Gammaproteobacteria bacterium]
MKNRTPLPVYLSILLLFPSILQAQTIEGYIDNEWPDSRYTDHGNGTVTDTKTGLSWKQCSEGQTASSGGCSGDASSYTWDQALQQPATLNSGGGYAGHSDWRLPNIKELASLGALDRNSPSINSALFPSTPSAWFWSSSPYAGSSYGAWRFSFSYGVDGYVLRGNYLHVRLVRGGQ